MSAPTDIHSLAGAYALHALDAGERELFDDHLAGCSVCRNEVAELRETAARLADDAWEIPPPRLRQQVLNQIASTRQALPPMRRSSRRGPMIRHRTRMLVAAGVAAIVAAAGVYAVQELRLRDQRISAHAEAQRIEAVLTAPDAVLRTSAVQGGGTLTIAMSPSRDQAVIMLRDAKTPDWNKVYQFWLIQGANPNPAGHLVRDQNSATRVVSGVRGMNVLGLTMEAPGGSVTPSLPILAQIPLT
ncbi:anti-sigma factor [Catelliglobosispora koreensis]|uniref:anti-sigma factor n=1 Tax=Catelliglobosispora koreensis TaxID=129052 RepID=UPI000369797D|nr:anti-sigma factor [Catelliglobosispora koreensis]